MNIKHGDARKGNRTSLYIVWFNMRQRCQNPNYRDYPRWGGRGIKLLWTDYKSFRSDMLPSYSPGLQIERRDNSGHYCKENCYWATARQQALNRRSCVILEFKGRSQNLTLWAEELGIHRNTLQNRIYHGWPVEKALTHPVQRTNRG